MQNFMKTILSGVQTWTKKEIKDNIKNSTADWNQNDESSADYVKNRTHWEEGESTCIIPEMTVSISEDGGYETLSESCTMLTVGQTYTVVLNGVTYKCVARPYDGDAALIGNDEVYGGDGEGNGEPFAIDSYDDGYIYLNVATAGEYTVSISVGNTVVHKLDSKYLDLINITNFIDENSSKLLTCDKRCTIPLSKHTSIAYGNGKFVATMNGSPMVAHSIDGIHWEQSYAPSNFLYDIVYGNDKFVAIERDISGEYVTSSCYWSVDGISWNHVYLKNLANYCSLTYGNGMFVAITTGASYYGDNYIAYSANGIDWESVAIPTEHGQYRHWDCITYCNGKFIALGDSYIISSVDGVNWIITPTGMSGNNNSIVYGNGKFIKCTGSTHTKGGMFYSEDGISWNACNDIPSVQICYSVTYNNNKFVATASDVDLQNTWMLYSADGISWQYTYVPYIYDSVTYGDEKFIATSRNGISAYSIDGVNWCYNNFELVQDKELKTDDIRDLLLNGYTIPIPAATVGQTIAVKSVDKNGKPTEWEAVALPSVDGLATEEYVDTSIANLVDSAPETLNTLNELATAIQENDNVIDTLNAAITNKITVPQDAAAGDLLTYDGTSWVRISRADLITEIIAALPRAEEATF